jgi:transposase
MARKTTQDNNTILYAQSLSKNTNSLIEFKKCLSITLNSVSGLDPDTIARILCVDRRTIFRYRKDIDLLAKGLQDPNKNDWGGRRNSLMTEHDEKVFLEPWVKKALVGELVDIKLINAAHIAAVGRKVTPSTTYRMLLRNGWRKIKPDTRHPKSEPAIQEELKKNWKTSGYRQQKKYIKPSLSSDVSR